jgi:hypothetical protein
MKLAHMNTEYSKQFQDFQELVDIIRVQIEPLQKIANRTEFVNNRCDSIQTHLDQLDAAQHAFYDSKFP